MLPAWDDRLLPAGQAASGQNGYLFSGRLEGWRLPKLLRNLNDTAASFVYRIPHDYTQSKDITAASTWLEFDDPETTVVRSQVADDQFDRYYIASPTLKNQQGISGPQYAAKDVFVAGDKPFLLGVPAPVCAPGVAVTGGGDFGTVGHSTNSTATGTGPLDSNYVYMVKITPNGAMDLLDVAVNILSTSATCSYMAVLYSDDGTGTKPVDLLNAGVVQTGFVAGTINSPFINPTGLLNGVNYWIGLMFTEPVTVTNQTDNNTGKRFQCTFSNGPPPIASTTAPSFDIQMWGDTSTQDVLTARSYVYTWVTKYGEESPPSPNTLVNGWSNGTWHITLWAPDPNDTYPNGPNRQIQTVRLYRTISATGGQTEYFWVADIPVGTLEYVDDPATTSDAVVALNAVLESTNWFPPPTDLQQIETMPNGMMVGWRGNEVWFCEPYRPHAWPPGYVLTTEFPIVGIAVAGQSVVVCTTSFPYIATGVHPSVCTLTKLQAPEPCLSRGSIISTSAAVFYSSPNGLIIVNPPGQVNNVTETWITRDRWAALTPPKYIHAIYLATTYFAFGVVTNGDATYAQQGFNIELNADASSFTIWPQPGGHRLGFMPMTAPNGYNVVGMSVDPWTGIGILIQNNQVYYYDFTDTNPTMQPYKWRSKIFQQTSKKNYSAMKVFFDIPSTAPVQGTRNQAATTDPSWNTLGPNQYGIIRVYGDGNLVTTREIYKSGELLRILSGFKVEQWQWEFEGRVRISNVQVATTAKELGTV